MTRIENSLRRAWLPLVLVASTVGSCALQSEHPSTTTVPMTTNRALLILDMQNDFCHADGKFHGMVQGELARKDIVNSTVKLVQSAQQQDVVTILSPIHFDYTQTPAALPEGIAASIIESRAFDKGAFGGRLIDELASQSDGEKVLIMPKPSLSAFANTPLQEMLTERGVKELVIAGMLTNFCVENTVRDAFDLGYRVRVVGDATATFSETQQDYAANTIFPMLGKVITVDDFVAAPVAY